MRNYSCNWVSTLKSCTKKNSCKKKFIIYILGNKNSQTILFSIISTVSHLRPSRPPPIRQKSDPLPLSYVNYPSPQTGQRSQLPGIIIIDIIGKLSHYIYHIIKTISFNKNISRSFSELRPSSVQ